ncbi:MAG: hypothetical protein U0176_13955 [Bacteroidia bacterium]
MNYCEYCVTADQVRRYEDSLGSEALDMSGLEIAQAFKYFDHESKDTSGNYYSWRVIGSMVDCSLHSYFAFERKVPGLSPVRVAVMYTLKNPESQQSESLYEVEWKFFFKDPVIERHVAPVEDTMEVDTAFVWNLYDTLVDRVADFFSKGHKVHELGTMRDTTVDRIMHDVDSSPNEVISQWSESSFFHVDVHKEWWELEDPSEAGYWGSRCPLDGGPYFFPDWRRHYRSCSWVTADYLQNSLYGPGREIGSAELEMGWAAAPDYSHRRQRPSGSKVHWFEVKPRDLAIYLVMQTVK